jgi:GT2 family glycosyltransferase
MNKQLNIAVVILNWNGEEDSLACVAALKEQTMPHSIIAVDNGSTDDFAKKMNRDSTVTLLKNRKNIGFSGGVNTGIRYALSHSFEFIALINNDALPDARWLSNLFTTAADDERIGVVDSKLLQPNGKIDSIGVGYSTWGLSYPIGRNENNTDTRHRFAVFSGSGGACLLRSRMLIEVGLFDEDFFAYYEDVDLCFRARLYGWKIIHEPTAIVVHKIGASSSKISDFTTYMTIKNLPWLLLKNVPTRLLPTILPRFIIAYSGIIVSSLMKGKFIAVSKGVLVSTILLPKKLVQRFYIQSAAVAAPELTSLLTYDVPPSALRLKKMQKILRRLRFWL